MHGIREETYLTLVFGAIALLVFVGYARLRWQIFSQRRSQRGLDAYERALRIQEERDRKFGNR